MHAMQEDGKANSTTKNGTGSSVGSSSSSHAPVHMNVHHRAVLNAAAGSGIIIDTLLSCGIISPTGAGTDKSVNSVPKAACA